MILKKLAVSAGTGVIALSLFASAAFADTTVTVKNNGQKSHNTVNVNSSSSTTITQGNMSDIGTMIMSKSTTGKNKNYGNTGGSSTITTGQADSSVGVTIGGSSNTINDTLCGCQPTGNTNITISENGNKSKSTVNYTSTNSTNVMQMNESSIQTMVSSSASTGGNQNSGNTGGSSNINTGDASSMVQVQVNGSSNTIN